MSAARQQTDAHVRPGHPTIGWISAAPIPAGEQQLAPVSAQFGPFAVMEAPSNIVFGVVLEIGPKPDGAHDELVPYTPNATVTYSEKAALRIAGTDYVPMAAIISWLEPEDRHA